MAVPVAPVRLSLHPALRRDPAIAPLVLSSPAVPVQPMLSQPESVSAAEEWRRRVSEPSGIGACLLYILPLPSSHSRAAGLGRAVSSLPPIHQPVDPAVRQQSAEQAMRDIAPPLSLVCGHGDVQITTSVYGYKR